MENSNSKPLREEQSRNDSGDKKKTELTEEKTGVSDAAFEFQKYFCEVPEIGRPEV